MNHVHWWLFGLSFAMGFVLTLTLILTSAKSPASVRISPNKATAPEPSTTKIPIAEPPTTRIPAGEQRTTRIPVTEQRTTNIPVTEQRTTNIPVTERRTTKIPVTKQSPTTKIPVSPPTPHGPGSAVANLDGRGPAGWLVKGRTDTEVYYTPDDPTYDPTVADVWFKDEKSALQAGFTRWSSKNSD